MYHPLAAISFAALAVVSASLGPAAKPPLSPNPLRPGRAHRPVAKPSDPHTLTLPQQPLAPPADLPNYTPPFVPVPVASTPSSTTPTR